MDLKTRHEIAGALLKAARKLEEGAKVQARASAESMDGALYAFTLKVAESIEKVANKAPTAKALPTVDKAKVGKDSGNNGNSVKGTGGTPENPIEWVVFVEPDKKNKFMRLRCSYIIFKSGSRARDDYMEFGSDETYSKIGQTVAQEMSRLVSLVGQ